MPRFAYSHNGQDWFGVYETREEAAHACAQDPLGSYEPDTAAMVWTGECVFHRAGSLGPSGSALLAVMENKLIEAPLAALDWIDKLRGLPAETLERLQQQVAGAIDAWAGSVGLQPRWFTVTGAHQRIRVLVGKKS